MKNVLTPLFLFICCILQAQSPSARPKIGLTLSGGGAKGLAHIGILKAIDSAGLKIDYITGTSMGSIVGGLYALGYSGDSIERLARNLDWDVLLTNQVSMRSLIMEEKGEYGKYAVELPLKEGKFSLPTGFWESQEMWIKLNEFFAPAYNIRDFDKLPIPFRCIGTEVSTGNALVLGSGNLVTAIRASMAIPTVFTAVDVDGCTVVDGGIVRNFPVSDVRDMGADYIIGSSVSRGLLPQEKLTDAAQILMQLIFLEDGLQHQEQAELCDIFIEHPVEGYSAGSFGKSDEIIDLGIAQGRRLYQLLKRLTDSLDAIYGKPEQEKNRLPKSDSVFISAYEVRGLKRTKADYFTRMMGFKPGQYYDVTSLASRVRNVFGTRYYQRILYELDQLPDGSVKVTFDAEEHAMTQAKLSLHYNTFSNLSLITNLTIRNLLTPASRSLVTLALSENFRMRGEYLQQFGRNNKMAFIGGMQFETFGFTSYRLYRPEGSQRQTFFSGALKLQYSTDRSVTVGAGWRYEWIKYKPKIQSASDLEGSNRIQSVFGYLSHNTLDAAVYPKKGLKMEFEAGYIFLQNPRLTVLNNGEPVPDPYGIGKNNFPRLTLHADWFKPLGGDITMLLQCQSGLNFNYTQYVLNDYAIGGLTAQFRNQITFAGLPEANLYTSSAAALLLGLRYEPFNNLYFMVRTNAAALNFVSRRHNISIPDFISGHAATLAYNTPIGPIEVSAMYSDQSKKVSTYVNLGLAF